MSEHVLLLVEATGIQNYVFGSNQLQQNIGASELVQQATTDWVFLALPSHTNVVVDSSDPDRWRLTDESLVESGLSAEVVYAGGGNAMILFADDGAAQACARHLTRRVLEEAPGLNLVLKRKSFDPQHQALAQVHQELRAELAQRKLDRPRSTPLSGLAVTAACVFTGAPAVALDGGKLISAEVQAKLNASAVGQERLGRHLADVKRAGYEFVYDFNDLGTKGTASYIAVAHTDGNNMGARIKCLAEQHGTVADNATYANKLRAFSRSVVHAARAALIRTAGLLLDSDNLSEGKLGGVVPILRGREGADLLPFRPIVFGGDDVTFVCDGRLGLTLAAKYLSELSNHFLSDDKPAYARAGVAVVKNHYPFARAYDLAEELCGSAKKYIVRRQGQAGTGQAGLTALDWHYATTGLVLPLEQMREREYAVTWAERHIDGKRVPATLLQRPLHLGEPVADIHSWATFLHVIESLHNPNGEWAGRRNKVKALREALRAGPEAVQLFLTAAGSQLPPLDRYPEMTLRGWQGTDCGYFDAIEALDLHVPLKGGPVA